MKALLIATSLVVSLPAFAHEPSSAQRFGSVLNDPRQTVSLYQMFDGGEEPKTMRPINNSIMIICWMPSAEGVLGSYQISGLDGYHTKEQVKKFLARFYESDHQKETQLDRPNIVLAGNNWGAGLELKETLKALSAKKSIAVFYAGGWAFSRVSLIQEPDSRKCLIERSYKEANK
ncbi:MAG: hypothetical protein KDK97_05655 [Verrucomicrobiales bacterium]|nr:hypothetical protein [Verrucomicrobiales bacterium]MCP5560659.1 hypothetical protein [Verrucomicrobiaceae bacterium]